MSDKTSSDPNASLADELAALRESIDTIDGQLLHLLNRRASCAQEVGKIKARHGDAGFIYRPEREAQVLRRLQQQNGGPLSDEEITFFFREIMSACLSLEEPLSVAFLGPLGTFTEAAAIKHFGHCARLLPQQSIDDALREVEAGHAHYAVAPVENSTEGAVGRTLDLLITTSLSVCGEVVVRIHQNLLAAGNDLASLTRVYAHAQSLAQCHEWLNHNLPQVERIPVASNAQAAQMAAQEDGSAAIASEAAGARYGLNRLAVNIEDEPNNTTRFIVLGHHDAGPSGQDKTSLILATHNRSGALFELLAPFFDAGVSMSRLESRPSRATLWEYVFFVDVEGHREDPAVAIALKELARRATWLKILGSYPVAVY